MATWSIQRVRALTERSIHCNDFTHADQCLLPRSEFYRLPEALLRKALDVLIKQSKAQVLKGLGEDGDGVKFV